MNTEQPQESFGSGASEAPAARSANRRSLDAVALLHRARVIIRYAQGAFASAGMHQMLGVCAEWLYDAKRTPQPGHAPVAWRSGGDWTDDLVEAEFWLAQYRAGERSEFTPLYAAADPCANCTPATCKANCVKPEAA
jgi:hypothetical protein